MDFDLETFLTPLVLNVMLGDVLPEMDTRTIEPELTHLPLSRIDSPVLAAPNGLPSKYRIGPV